MRSPRQGRRRTDRPPVLASVAAVVALAFFVVPLVGLMWRAPWSSVGDIITLPEVRDALWLSLKTSLMATTVCLALGIPLAWILARVEFPGRRVLRALVTLPMVLPPVVGGIALLYAFGRRGLVGQWLDRWFGITFPFSTKGVVLAQAFVAMPFLIITAEAAFRSLDHRFEDAARTLGANRFTVFRRVTIPLAAPALIAGTVLCWARALGEFGASITFAGNFPGETQTMPLAVFQSLESPTPEVGIVLSLVLLAVSLAVLVGLRDRWLNTACSNAPGERGLEAHVEVALGEFSLDVELSVPPGRIVALLGPNGAGKTTLLRVLAGLLPPDAGRVVLDGRVLDDTETGEHAPAETRPVGVVFQDYLLFPHMTATENVAFGMRSRGVPKAEARRRAGEWLEQVGLADFAGRRPRQLSGGQAQRVALARALATEPRLLLLDEPLAALDASTRLETRRSLRRQLEQYDGVRILVTHDPLEAIALAERLVVLEEGRVSQTGTPQEISERPRSRYVADLVGVNLLRGQAHGDEVTLGSGTTLAAPEAGHGDVFVVIHPHSVALYRQPPGGTPRNVWAGEAEGLDFEGERVRVRVGGPLPIVAEVTPAAVADLQLGDGGPVWVSVKATELRVYPV